MASKEIKIVHFNVGGVKYDVARALIEAYPGTMLARLVSDTWQQDLGSEIFIDRNGQRFQYVLDYMRDQEVNLPLNAAKGSVMKELEYFGFEHGASEAIKVSCTYIEAVEQVSMYQKDHQAELKELEDTKNYSILAFECATRLGEGDNMSRMFISKTTNEPAYDVLRRSRFYQSQDVECFNQCLAKYNLRYCSHDQSVCGTYWVSLEKLDTPGTNA